MAEEAPECDFDESTKAGYVRVRLRIPGIKPSTGFRNKGKNAEKGNADIEGPLYGNDNQSITVLIHDKGGLDNTNYRYHVGKLPDRVVPEKTDLTVKKDWVIMFLKKTNKSKSWETQFRNGSLETS